jgi:hypothetical protein
MPPLPEAQIENEHVRMKRLLLVTAFALTVGLAALRLTPDEEQSSDRSSDLPSAAEAQRCISRFDGLDKNSDGVLNANELENLKKAVKDADKNKDGKIRSSEHQAACATGVLTDSDIKS